MCILPAVDDSCHYSYHWSLIPSVVSFALPPYPILTDLWIGCSFANIIVVLFNSKITSPSFDLLRVYLCQISNVLVFQHYGGHSFCSDHFNYFDPWFFFLHWDLVAGSQEENSSSTGIPSLVLNFNWFCSNAGGLSVQSLNELHCSVCMHPSISHYEPWR